MAEKAKDIGGHIVIASIIFGGSLIFAAHLASSRITETINGAVEKMSTEVGRAADNTGRYTIIGKDQRTIIDWKEKKLFWLSDDGAGISDLLAARGIDLISTDLRLYQDQLSNDKKLQPVED